MAGTRVKIVRLAFSTQATVLVQLPDIPGVVVLVNRVLWMIESVSAVAAIGVRLYHDTDVSKTLAFADIPGALWFSSSQGGLSGDPPPVDIGYEPPLELIGVQRCDHVASTGNVIGHLVIHYTTRRERNRTVWNELRARTSFERD